MTAVSRSLLSTLLLVLLTLSAGCEVRQPLRSPDQLVSPYPQQQIWAVAPFVNESGVSIVDPLQTADRFAMQVQQIDGIDALPVNRVLLAMRQLEIDVITTPTDAASVMAVLNADGLIVGTVTAYDPYPPPTLGAAIELYTRDGDMNGSSLDPLELVRSPSESDGRIVIATRPRAQAAGIFDARNHNTLAALETYTTGRTRPDSAFGPRIYQVNIDLYTEFVAHQLLGDVLMNQRHQQQQQEQELTSAAADASTSSSR